MLIPGKDKWLSGKETWSYNSFCTACSLQPAQKRRLEAPIFNKNGTGKESRPLRVRLTHKEVQCHLHEHRVRQGHKVLERVQGRQHFKPVGLSLYQVLTVQVWPEVTGRSYTQTGSRSSSFSLDPKKNSANQWERKAPPTRAKGGEVGDKNRKHAEEFSCIQCIHHSSFTLT